jgi:hypothetical protein
VGAVGEAKGGLEYYYFICNLLKAMENDWPSVLQKFKDIQALVFRQQGALVHATVDDASLTKMDPHITNFLSALPLNAPLLYPYSSPAPILPVKHHARVSEGLAVPTQVNYVGKAANLYEHGYKYDASIAVVDKYLGMAYMWDQVRVLGGAYGAFTSFSRHTGVFKFLSYRDPNLLTTLDTFDGAARYLKNLDIDDDSLNKAIVGTIGDVDKYQLPDQKGSTALGRYLHKDTAEERGTRRAQVRALNSLLSTPYAPLFALPSSL